MMTSAVTAIGGRGEKFLRDALDVARFDLPLVCLHDVADDLSYLLGFGDAQRAQAILDERAQRDRVQHRATCIDECHTNAVQSRVFGRPRLDARNLGPHDPASPFEQGRSYDWMKKPGE